MNRKKIVIIYGRGSQGSKGDLLLTRSLLHEGYKVLLINPSDPNDDGDKKKFYDLITDEGVFRMDIFREELDWEEVVRKIVNDFEYTYSSGGPLGQLIEDGSIPYAFIHMGFFTDEASSFNNSLHYFRRNVSELINYIQLYKMLGMKKFILNNQVTNLNFKSPYSTSVNMAIEMLKNTISENELRIIRYTDIIGEMVCTEEDDEKDEESIILGNSETSVINIVAGLDKDDLDNKAHINLNEKIYKDRLSHDTKTNGVCNYVFGDDLVNLHLALLDRDFDNSIPPVLNVGFKATTNQILERYSEGGELEFKFTPEDTPVNDYNNGLDYNIPEELGYVQEINSIKEALTD